MPYVVHPKDIELKGEFSPWCEGAEYSPTMAEDNSVFRTFDSRASAHASKTAAERVTYVPTHAEKYAWYAREEDRFDTGTYINVPWSDDVPTRLRRHYAHLSLQAPGMVAYTPDDEYGYQDRQIRVKPGRYLEQFYNGNYPLSTVERFIAACQLTNLELQIARTPEDIRKIYASGSRGSCMSPGPSNVCLEGKHPTEVYGNSDLGVAYYGPIDNVSARAVVWPDRKRYGRLYGTEDGGHIGTNGEVLRRLLMQAGYEDGNMYGARIRAIRTRNHGSYLMPYIDGADYVRLSGDMFIIGEGGTDCSDTSGYVYLSSSDNNPDYDDDDVDDTEWARCEHCNSQYDADDDNAYGGWCASCTEDSFNCESCNERYDSDDSRSPEFGEHRNSSFCESCYENLHETCADSDCGHTFIPDNFDRFDTADRERRHVTDLCADCAAVYEYCDTCEAAYNPDSDGIVCPTCETHVPRCTLTGDLLSAVVDMPTVDHDKSAIEWCLTRSGDSGGVLCTIGNHFIKVAPYDIATEARNSLQRMYPEHVYDVVHFSRISAVDYRGDVVSLDRLQSGGTYGATINFELLPLVPVGYTESGNHVSA